MHAPKLTHSCLRCPEMRNVAGKGRGRVMICVRWFETEVLLVARVGGFGA